MAQLIPSIDVKQIELKPERDVARCLVDQLPNNCIIYHSYPWLRVDRNDRGFNTYREGETDFVIILPSHGMLVLEVKGGEIKYCETSRSWDRVLPNGQLRSLQDPFEQARRNTHYLEQQIRSKAYAKAPLPFAFGYAAIFPDCDYSGSTPVGAEPGIVFSAKDLPHMKSRVNSALTQWSRRDQPVNMSLEDIKKVKGAISPAFKLQPMLSRTLASQDEKLIRLTNEQSNLLNFLGNKQRACIEGVAGSGKTILAKAQAVKFAEQGKSVLFVCFNKTLANWIKDSISEDDQKQIKVMNFHALCAEWANKAGIEFSPCQDDLTKFWTDTAPELLVEAIDQIQERFGAVIVDEGQDFYPNWWLPLELINSAEDNGAMYVFYDPSQNLYVEQAESLPPLGEPLFLPTNCRNTRAIAAKCSDILDVEIHSSNRAPQGIEPTTLSVECDEDTKKHLETVITQWIKKGKLTPSQIVILCPKTKAKSAIKNMTSINEVAIVGDVDQWCENAGVLFSTIKNFKGLEADAVIVMDVPASSEAVYFKKSDYYVACSRAKHLLVVMQNLNL